MISKYSISNFKIHKSGYIFNLNGLTILTGTNNSGKSSLTQSLRLLSKINRNSFSYTKLPFEQIPELGDFKKTLNKEVSRRESIKYKLSLKIENLKFCNVELEFDSVYNYKLNFVDMADTSILKRIDIYFKNSSELVKNYEFVINTNNSNPITYDLNEIILNDKEEKRILLEKGILVKGLYPNFIPKFLQQGFKELLTINAHLGNINENSIKYIPALRNNGNTADILDNFKENIIFDNETRLLDAFYIWTNKILNSKFKLKIEENKRKIVALENNIEFDLLQIGFGNTQILPILITILTAKRGDLVIIENPEVHLHPKWKTNLVELFYYAVKFGVNILIETQSLEIVNRIRLSVKNDNTLKDKTSLYFFENHSLKCSIQKIEIEDTGSLDLWPDDFVDKVTIEDNFGLL
ncbi:AAA family ATPase [Clostridium drakei]|uniref:ATPase AAA-type core domain-containing protein n=1 Tax=Clostridium drakei TaxID=332101 RepID=A0A2U8DRM3_9CLOT|nr:AAA family ATPase [Clostridium drakei]AWI05131.1 hypothetical protein B9W14_11670 [Clostridium drakei]